MSVVSLRGTSGAGKSTVVHQIRRLYGSEVVRTTGPRKRPLVYHVNLPSGPLYVLGAYETQCGGCDAIQDYGDVVPALLDEYAPEGHVLFEGLLLSGGIGRVGEAVLRHNGIFAFLDTPLELCLERVNQRRAARGVMEPVNPRNTEQKHVAMHRSIQRVRELGGRVAMVRHEKAFIDVMRLLGVTGVRTPRFLR